MNRLMQPEPRDQDIIETLRSRDGLETRVELKNGKIISVWNIAWGYDMGDDFAHLTTNISPNIDGTLIDFFYTNEIKRILIDEE